MQRPVLFLARSWHGHGGMQRLNRDVAAGLQNQRGSLFRVIHPAGRSVFSLLSFCVRSLIVALGSRGRGVRVHGADVAVLPLALLCRWLNNGTLSVTACGLDVIYPKGWYQAMVHFCLKRCNQVICISHATADEVRKRAVPDERISVIPCGIHPSDRPLSEERDPHLLVTVGRLVKRKGVAWFAENVFPRLLTTNPHLKYVIIGDGPECLIIESIINRLHLAESVSLWTDASDDVRQSVLDTAALFVVPNIRVPGDMEGFGIVCVEAGERGLQVAAANIEGLKDAVIDGTTGRLFKPRNVDDCVRVVSDLLQHRLSSSVVRAATFDRYSWERIFPLYNDVFDQ